MSNQQSITEISSTTPSYNLLLEIAQIPEEYIPEFLQIVRLFRENLIRKQSSINDDKNIETGENHQLSWQEFINKTAGSCADDPIIIDDLGIDDTLDDRLEDMII
ncbi:hypothetical protein B6N60_01245 [Richelia sinica FACHB-800]|uniref:Uncharacterized protein n=1 Tax=Richelia sinica FACHB-800 TaxID=1357546 RepID=A0A975T6V8_9NOST|nr:hypothetical protein [Richelia sinica]MBD2664216.1 hypothetical protein [Richelia sinica FACHB-800]QXE22562.1 hypothetical protein B6N60_01245 [Richelia sinica FACHB-800]